MESQSPQGTQHIGANIGPNLAIAQPDQTDLASTASRAWTRWMGIWLPPPFAPGGLCLCQPIARCTVDRMVEEA